MGAEFGAIEFVDATVLLVEVVVVFRYPGETPRCARRISSGTAFDTWLSAWLEGESLQRPSLFESPMPSLFHVWLPLQCRFLVVSARKCIGIRPLAGAQSDLQATVLDQACGILS